VEYLHPPERNAVMKWYLWVKWLHVVSSTVLFGTGLGIAFFFVRAQRTQNIAVIASVSRDVVFADLVFTAIAVVICWLRAVWLQLWMRDLAAAAQRISSPLPSKYQEYYRQWFALGWPAFAGVMAIFYLMVAKPRF
jgi:uncharacterized membrane protein